MCHYTDGLVYCSNKACPHGYRHTPISQDPISREPCAAALARLSAVGKTAFDLEGPGDGYSCQPWDADFCREEQADYDTVLCPLCQSGGVNKEDEDDDEQEPVSEEDGSDRQVEEEDEFPFEPEMSPYMCAAMGWPLPPGDSDCDQDGA